MCHCCCSGLKWLAHICGACVQEEEMGGGEEQDDGMSEVTRESRSSVSVLSILADQQ